MNDVSPPPKAALGAELALPAIAVGFTVYFFYSVKDLVWEAKANAVIIGVALLLLIAVHAVRLVLLARRRGFDFSIEPLIAPRRVLGQRLLMVVLAGLFVVLIPWLGLTLGLFLLTGALMLALRAGSWRLIVATSAIVAVSAYLLFVALLHSRLPHGPVEKLISWLL